MTIVENANLEEPGQETDAVQHFQIIITSPYAGTVEEACSEIISGLKKRKLHMEEPVCTTSKMMRKTFGKTPPGDEGSKKWETLHRGVIDLHMLKKKPQS